MTALFVLLGIVVFAGAFLAGTGRLGALPEAEPDLRPDTRDGEPQFDVVVRGYRMDEVDEQVARLQQTIDDLRAGRTDTEADAEGAVDVLVDADADADPEEARP